MPLEIKELQINVTVNQQKGKEAAAASTTQDDKDDRKNMMKQCLDEMMDIINNQKER